MFWGVDDPFFEETLDIYYSFYQLVKDKKSGNDCFREGSF